MKIDDFVEKEGPAGRPREPSGDQLVPVGEEGVALRAREETAAADVFQVNASHVSWKCGTGQECDAASKRDGDQSDTQVQKELFFVNL